MCMPPVHCAFSPQRSDPEEAYAVVMPQAGCESKVPTGKEGRPSAHHSKHR